MNIQAEKLEIIKMILKTDNPGCLYSIKDMLSNNTENDFWETLPQYQKDDIIKGLKDIEDGDFVDYEDFIKKHR